MVELDLSDNNIGDLTSLGELTQLVELDLGVNNISNLAPLAQLTQLTDLFLEVNQISNLAPLAQLTQLTNLSLLLNKIRDISPLAHLKQLTNLYLSRNQVSDVTPLAELTESLTRLGLRHNQVRDVTPLAQLTYLENLDLVENKIIDVTPLAQLIYLEELKLRNNPITDTSPLSPLLDENPDVRIDIEVIRETRETKSGLTITASTPSPLSTITLNGSVVTLTLSGGNFASSLNIRNVLKISGITGINFGVYENDWGWDENDINRISDTEITFDLAYRGTINADTKLIVSVGPGAIKNYNGPALTAEIPVSAASEAEVTGELIASTPFPLTKATLDGSYVKLTLKNKSFGYLDNEGIMVTTSGIPGVGIRRLDVLNERKVLVVQLPFKGNLDADATLTFIVPQTLIKDYDGPPLVATLPVTVKTGKQVLVSETSRPSVYWINKDTHRIESVEPFDAVTNQVRSLTVDAVGGKVYWSEQSSSGGIIKRANLNGTGVEQLISLSFIPTDITIDSIADKLYWVNSRQGTIQSTNLNGENIKTIIKRDDHIVDIAIDAERGKLYWAHQYSIWRVNFDGTGVETPLSGWGTKQTKGIGGMAVVEGKIYWTEHLRWGSTIGNIHRANLNGTDVETLATPLGTPNGIAVDTAAGMVYWANSLGGIQRADINDGEVEAVVSGITALEDFVLVSNTQETALTPTTEATTSAVVGISPASVTSPTVGQQFAFTLNIIGSEAVAGYQATVQFDTTALRFISGANGDYLPAGAFFVQPVVEGNSIKLNAASLAGESSGDGTLATLTFEVITVKPSTLTLSSVLLSNKAGESSRPQVKDAQITEPTRLRGDVNGDGIVNIQDLVLTASSLGQTGQNRADVNSDGIVNIQDLVLVAGALGTGAAAPFLLHPSSLGMLTSADVHQWLFQARQLSLTDAMFQRGILFLEQLLAALIPQETVLLPNYPNPFNPETWIPYQLAVPADVSISIYSSAGQLVRTLDLGHQLVGIYESRSRAAYWNGRNAVGESVASGVYFYTLTAGDFTATRKMLILK